MSPPAPVLMYAELLSNINRVSVLAALETLSTPETRATLSENGRHIQLVHDGTTTILALPASASSVKNLKQPPLGSHEASWSMGLRSPLTANRYSKASDTPAAPWQASQVPVKAQVSCRNCGNVLVTAGTVETWKDLPSENWAEMMDFWHCHKPDVHKQDTTEPQLDNYLEERGYGANRRFTAQIGVGFVDLTYFLLSKGNCEGIKVDSPLEDTSDSVILPEALYCDECNVTVGAVDQLSNGLRLYKWSLVISDINNIRRPTYPVCCFVAALLLSQISSQAISRFIIHSTESRKAGGPILLTWVFAPYLTVSFSAAGSVASAPIQASKIFYREISADECATMLENASMSIEEIRLPAETMMQLAAGLRESTVRIPPSARKFREWDVGFLERFAEETDQG